MVSRKNYTVTGAVSAEDGFYIPRLADEQLLQLCRDHIYAHVLAPRQVGKTSLMYRTAAQLLEEEITPISVDLTEVGKDTTAARWYPSILQIIAREAPLRMNVAQWWQAQSGTSSLRFSQFFREILLREITTPIVVFIDEIDTILSLDFADDADNFYTAIRSLHEARHRFPELQRLSFVLLGVATPGDLIRDPKRTTLNVGQQVELTDWTVTEALPLAAGLGLPQPQAEQVLEWVLKWTGGHPYLTQRICQVIAEAEQSTWNESEVDRIVGQTFFGQQGAQDTNLQFVRNRLTRSDLDSVAVLKTYRDIRRGNRVLDEEQSVIKSHLKISGVVKRAGRELQVRNPIYRQVFDLKWIKEHLPETLLQRLKPALPLIAILGVAALGMGGLAVYANGQASRAEESAKQEAEKTKELESANKELERRGSELLKQRDTANRQTILAENRLKESQEAKRQAEIARASEGMQRKKAEEQTVVAETARQAEANQRRQAVFAAQSEKEQRRKAEIATADAEKRQKEAELGEIAARAETLLSSARPVDGLVQAIQGINKGIEYFGEQNVLRPIQHSLFNAVNLARERNVLPHNDPIYAVALSPNGRYLASVNTCGFTVLWDIQSDKGEPITQRSRIECPDSMPNITVQQTTTEETFVIETKNPDGTITKVRGKRPPTTTIDKFVIKEGSTASSIAFSDDGQLIASSAFNELQVWNLRTGQRNQYKGHTDRVSAVAISPDSQWIVTGSWDKTLRVWDRQGNPIGRPMKGHTAEITSVAISPDGKMIASGSVDKTIRLWDMQGNPIGQPIRGHEDVVTSVAFNPKNDQELVSGSKDATIRLWNFQGQPIRQPFRGHGGTVTAVRFSPDRRVIISVSTDGTIRFWDRVGNPLGQPLIGGAGLTSLAVSSNGTTIASGTTGESVKVWDLNSRQFALSRQDEGEILSVTTNSNGNTVLTQSRSEKELVLRLWAIQGEAIASRRLSSADITSTSFIKQPANITPEAFSWGSAARLVTDLTHDGQLFALAQDKEIHFGDVSVSPYKPTVINEKQSGIRGKIEHIRFSRDRRTVVVVDQSNTFYFFDISQYPNVKLIGETPGKSFGFKDSSVLSIALSADAQTVAFTTKADSNWKQGSALHILDLSNKSSVIHKAFEVIDLKKFSPLLAMSADGQTIVGSRDNAVLLWNKNGKEIAQFSGHTAPVTSVDISDDGQIIVSGSQDSTVRVWDRNGNELVPALRGHTKQVTSVSISGDGKTVISGSDDETARLWHIGTWQDWLQVACNRLQYHPVFKDPKDDVTKGAKDTCQKHVWKR